MLQVIAGTTVDIPYTGVEPDGTPAAAASITIRRMDTGAYWDDDAVGGAAWVAAAETNAMTAGVSSGNFWYAWSVGATLPRGTRVRIECVATDCIPISHSVTCLGALVSQLGDEMVLDTDYDAAKSAAQAGDEMDIVDAPNSTAVGVIQSGLATSANQTTILARLGAWTGTGVNTLLGAMKALLSKTASVPSDIGGTFAASTDSTEAISDKIDMLSAGSGAKSVVVTVVDGDADPVRCDLLIPNVASGITNASTGALTLMLDVGTYSVSLGPAGGYTFSNPYTLTVTSAASQTATLTCAKVSIADPAGSDECKVYGYVYDQNNDPVQNAVIKARPYTIPALTDADGVGIQTKQKSYLTNASGYFEIVLVRSSEFDPVVYYEIECDAVGYRKIVEVPDAATKNWYDLEEASV